MKSAAYLQTWEQSRLSTIEFGIRQTQADAFKRQADLYIFSLLAHKDKGTLDPLDASQWIFYLVPTVRLNERFPTQKTLRLSSLMTLDPVVARYQEIAKSVALLAQIVR